METHAQANGEYSDEYSGDFGAEAVRNFPRLAKHGALRKFVEARAAWHGVTPYAYLLHVLSVCKWCVKGIVQAIGGTPASIYSTMKYYHVNVTTGHGGAMGALAARHGNHDVVEFGIEMIRKYGNHKRAARVLNITPIQFYAPFIARDISFNAVQYLQFNGDTALYSVRGACQLYGMNYQYMQQSYYAAKEEGLEFANFTAYAAERFKRMGKHAKAQSVLGWPRVLSDALIAQGQENCKAKSATAAVLRTVNKSKWKRSAT